MRDAYECHHRLGHLQCPGQHSDSCNRHAYGDFGRGYHQVHFRRHHGRKPSANGSIEFGLSAVAQSFFASRLDLDGFHGRPGPLLSN